MKITHKFEMDFFEKDGMPKFNAVQGDGNTRVVEVTLLAGGEAWQVPEGTSVSVAFRNLKDGHKGWYDKLPNGLDACAVNGNVVTATLAPAVLSGDGEVLAAIVLQDADLNQLATFGFSILVEKNPAAGASKHNDYYAYTTMEAVSEAVDAMLDALENTKSQLGQLIAEANAAVTQVSRDAGTAIVSDAAGEVIAVADASDRALRGLTLYGKTIQNGTPTPDAPVALDSTGNGGGIGVKVVGKNLYDHATYKNIGNKYKMYVAGGKTLYRNSKLATRASWGVYDKNGTLLGTFADYNFTPTNPLVLPTNASYIISNDPSTEKDMYIGYFENTDYEPYTEQVISLPVPNGLPGIPVASGGNYTDASGQQWVCDEIDLARGVYVQRVGKYVYDGVSIAIGTHSNGQKYCSFQIATAAQSTLFGDGVKVLSDRYKAWHWTDTDNGVYLSGNALVICDSRFVNSTTAKNILFEEQAVFLYILKTPIEIDLSILAEAFVASGLHSNKPNTTVLNDGGAGQRIAYVADTKTYIDNKFKEVTNAIIAIGTI